MTNRTPDPRNPDPRNPDPRNLDPRDPDQHHADPAYEDRLHGRLPYSDPAADPVRTDPLLADQPMVTRGRGGWIAAGIIAALLVVAVIAFSSGTVTDPGTTAVIPDATQETMPETSAPDTIMPEAPPVEPAAPTDNAPSTTPQEPAAPAPVQ